MYYDTIIIIHLLHIQIFLLIPLVEVVFATHFTSVMHCFILFKFTGLCKIFSESEQVSISYYIIIKESKIYGSIGGNNSE